ncbi:hypothetical protein [Paenibacillus sp. MBLB4367]|uniref:hypothetical protein n=1 Tax=Paenibacillus sp. MBLB4367 TaxID=3384767 RepID=UPI0039081DDB
MRRFAWRLLLLGVLIAVLIHDKAPERIRPVGTLVTFQQLQHDLPLVIKKPIKVHQVKLIKDGKIPCGKYCADDFTMGPYNGTAISVSLTAPENSNEPDPVLALIRIWMYLQQHRLIEPINAVYTDSHRRWIIDGTTTVGLSRDDFKEMYAPYRFSDMTEEEITIKLVEQWIEINDFYGY